MSFGNTHFNDLVKEYEQGNIIDDKNPDIQKQAAVDKYKKIKRHRENMTALLFDPVFTFPFERIHDR